MDTSVSRRIDLVIGPSGAGKSNYIAEMDLDPDAIIFAYELADREQNPFDEGHTVVHYNSIRPFQLSSEDLDRPLETDPVLSSILGSGAQVTATVLVASASVLSKRAILRTLVEPELRDATPSYPNGEILDLLNRLDLGEHYTALIELLASRGVETTLLESNDGIAPLGDGSAELDRALAVKRSDYSAEEIDFVLEKYHFEYHSIELPHGRRTPGALRTDDLLESLALAGRSVLDIGCGYGSACYRAIDHGAASASGTELKPHRYVGALVVKNILDSDITIHEADVFGAPSGQRHDVVLLLNVIHHLPEPFKALNVICDLALETFVVEFPTLADPKFLATLPVGTRLAPDLPLVGVSTSAEDQTFVFSVAALERFMAEQHPEFSVEIRASAIAESRKVMVATRQAATTTATPTSDDHTLRRIKDRTRRRIAGLRGGSE